MILRVSPLLNKTALSHCQLMVLLIFSWELDVGYLHKKLARTMAKS